MAGRLHDRVVFITGASSGIGRSCARAMAGEGARLLLAARRIERLTALEPELTGLGARAVRSLALDVRDDTAVSRAVAELPDDWKSVEVLLNNAGLSRGLGPLHAGLTADWNEMIDTNVKGLLSVNRAVVPLMVQAGRGIVVHLGSIAGRQVYPGGNVYCATKHAVRALTDALRLDLLDTGVRVCSIDPGLVRTEFGEVRFHGDRQRAAAVYRGMTPLTPEDVAEAVLFAVTRPAHVCVAEVLLLPADQASAEHVRRRG